MQFSYNISEDEFLKAVRLRCRRNSSVTKIVMFWAFILICLVLLWGTITRSRQSSAIDDAPVPTDVSPTSSSSWFPITMISVGLVVVLQIKYWSPRRLRRLYRKDLAMQGRFTVEMTPESLEIGSTAGFTSRSNWNLYEFWSEKNHLIVLVLLSSAFVVLNTAGLPEPQRAELRGILSSAVPQK